MSELLHRLERVNRGSTTAMGFGAAGRVEKVPGMALIGSLSAGKRFVQGAATLSKIGADGALITGSGPDGIPSSVAEALKGVPWGVRVPELTGEHAAGYREKGCDFLAFEPQRTQVGALEDEDTAYVLCVPSGMDEQSLRAIEDLPVDAVLLTLESIQPPLTLEHLLAIGVVRGSFSKYLLLEAPASLSSGELEGLKEVGVDGLVVDATSLSAKEMEGLRDRLLSLPQRQRRARITNAFPSRDAYSSQAGPALEDDDDQEF